MWRQLVLSSAVCMHIFHHSDICDKELQSAIMYTVQEVG